MIAISINELSLHYGTTVILDKVSFGSLHYLSKTKMPMAA